MPEQNLVEELMFRQLETFHYDYETQIKGNPRYVAANSAADEARAKLEQAVQQRAPGMLDLVLSQLPKGSNFDQALTRISRKRDNLHGLVAEYEDALAFVEMLATESAFEAGFKAGVRLQDDLKRWAQT